MKLEREKKWSSLGAGGGWEHPAEWQTEGTTGRESIYNRTLWALNLHSELSLIEVL
jgi:hypothetical protein